MQSKYITLVLSPKNTSNLFSLFLHLSCPSRLLISLLRCFFACLFLFVCFSRRTDQLQPFLEGHVFYSLRFLFLSNSSMFFLKSGARNWLNNASPAEALLAPKRLFILHVLITVLLHGLLESIGICVTCIHLVSQNIQRLGCKLLSFDGLLKTTVATTTGAIWRCNSESLGTKPKEWESTVASMVLTVPPSLFSVCLDLWHINKEILICPRNKKQQTNMLIAYLRCRYDKRWRKPGSYPRWKQLETSESSKAAEVCGERQRVWHKCSGFRKWAAATEQKLVMWDAERIPGWLIKTTSSFAYIHKEAGQTCIHLLWVRQFVQRTFRSYHLTKREC